jgi:hypothetical protein
LVWATKILTDPFHDLKLYSGAPYRLLKCGMRNHIDDEFAFDHHRSA